MELNTVVSGGFFDLEMNFPFFFGKNVEFTVREFSFLFLKKEKFKKGRGLRGGYLSICIYIFNFNFLNNTCKQCRDLIPFNVN